MRDQIKINRPATWYVLPVMAVILFVSQAWAKPNPKVLVFCKTTGYHHASIAAGIVAIQKLGAENKFDVDTTTDVKKFTDANLKQYATLIFLSPTGRGVFNDSTEKDAFKHYMEAGGGFVGIHAATDFEYDWQWYGNLIGGYFLGHPKNNVQEAVINVVDTKNAATKGLPAQWKRKDEYYSYRPGSNPKDLHVLLTLDESTVNYGTQTNLKMGDFHPLAWYHDFDGGRSFYTELGHTDETYADPLFLNHLLAGIKYAMGKKYKGK
jgi:type 1 glutamine amidotransferase